jgi:hypothetical protein
MGITPFNDFLILDKEIIFIEPKYLGHNNGLIRRGGNRAQPNVPKTGLFVQALVRIESFFGDCEFVQIEPRTAAA